MMITVVSGALQGQATTAGDPCDPKLVRAGQDPLRYERRGERCEGLYIQEVAGRAGLLVASFIESSDPFDIVAGKPLPVGWSTAAQSPVRLRAIALRSRLYYRMDSERPGTPGMFEWPTDLLVSLQMHADEIGLVGWMEQRVGGQQQDVYVPLRLGARSSPPSGRYVVTIVPGSEMSEVYLTLAQVNADGHDSRKIKDAEPLKYGYYPAERPLKVRLPTLDRPGLYRLELGATLGRGGSVTKSLLFYHPGE